MTPIVVVVVSKRLKVLSRDAAWRMRHLRYRQEYRAAHSKGANLLLIMAWICRRTVFGTTDVQVRRDRMRVRWVVCRRRSEHPARRQQQENANQRQQSSPAATPVSARLCAISIQLHAPSGRPPRNTPIPRPVGPHDCVLDNILFPNIRIGARCYKIFLLPFQSGGSRKHQDFKLLCLLTSAILAHRRRNAGTRAEQVSP